MYNTIKDFYGHNISITFDLIHNLTSEGSKETTEKIATIKIMSSVTSVASSEESPDWHITIEKTFFYGRLVINHLIYSSDENQWHPRVCLKEGEKYDYKNFYDARNINVEIF